jgi:hypothetical protein
MDILKEEELYKLRNPERNKHWKSFREKTKEQILEWEARRLALFLEIDALDIRVQRQIRKFKNIDYQQTPEGIMLVKKINELMKEFKDLEGNIIDLYDDEWLYLFNIELTCPTG